MVEESEILILCALPMEARAIERALGRGKFDVRTVGMRATRIPKIEAKTRVVIVAGLAGGLDPTLKVGEVVLDVNHAHGLPSVGFSTFDSWRAGSIHTSSCAICSAEEKRVMFERTGALAVDMEQSAFAQTGIPLIGLRAISDPAHMAVDPAVLQLVDDTGRVRPLSVFSTLFARPGLIGHLRELNSNSKLALRELGKAINTLVEFLTAES
jgi:hypothetical protein